jgi:dTDP-4-dehydrorhamnose reductase
MKTWVIGQQGMLARSLTRELRLRKIEFLATRKEEVDITSKSAVVSFIEKNHCDYIINCAAYTAVDLAEKEKEKAYDLNVLGVENLLDAAKRSSAKLIHISSDYIFDGKKNSPYLEEETPAPLSIYGQTKWEAEKRIEKSHLSYCILRLSWLLGYGENHFVAKILHKMKSEKELFVVDDQRGRMTSSEDAARVILQLLPYEGIFHFANAEEASWYEIASFIFQEVKKLKISIVCEKIHPIRSEEYPTAAKRPSYSVLDTTKVERLLNIAVRSWREVVREYLQEEARK